MDHICNRCLQEVKDGILYTQISMANRIQEKLKINPEQFLIIEEQHGIFDFIEAEYEDFGWYGTDGVLNKVMKFINDDTIQKPFRNVL